MKTVTISTIVRDGEKTIENYHKLLQELVKFSDSKFYLSLYENDSVDNTRSIIEKLDWSFIENKVTFEKIGTKKDWLLVNGVYQDEAMFQLINKHI